MVASRTATALLGIVVSVLVSVLAWVYFDMFLFFLIVPFVPFLFRRSTRLAARECPVCGFRTRGPDSNTATVTGLDWIDPDHRLLGDCYGTYSSNSDATDRTVSYSSSE